MQMFTVFLHSEVIHMMSHVPSYHGNQAKSGKMSGATNSETHGRLLGTTICNQWSNWPRKRSRVMAKNAHLRLRAGQWWGCRHLARAPYVNDMK